MNDVSRRLGILQMLSMQKNNKEVPVFLPIKKPTVDSFDIEPLYDVFNVLTLNSDFVRCYQNRIGFEFEGYKEEEIFKDKSLRKFLQNLQEKFPYMFWFSVKTAPGGTDVPFLKHYLYFQCRFDFETDLGTHMMRKLNQADLEAFLLSSESGLKELQQSHNLTEAEVTNCLTDVDKYIRKNVLKNL